MTYTLMPGKPCTASEEETLSTIRSVLTEHIEPEPKSRTFARKKAVAQPEAKATAFVERTTEANPRRRSDDLPALETVQETAPRKPARRKSMNVSRLVTAPLAWLRAFRPSTRHLAVVSSLLLLVVRPHWFVIGAVLMLATVIGAFLILGSERIWRAVTAGLARVEARDPARATELRNRLDRFACRWDTVLDILPDGMADGLYMPDLQAMQNADAAHTTAMEERLNRMVHDS